MDGKETIIFNVNGVQELCKMFTKVNGKLCLLSLGCIAFAIYSEHKSNKQQEEIERLDKELKELKHPKGE